MERNNNRVIQKCIACLMIAAGAIVAYLPLGYWEFLVTYQFRPTVRPYYPILYGAFLLTGIIIIGLGLIGLMKKVPLKDMDSRKRGRMLILPMLSLIIGITLPIAVGTLFSTTSYLIADGLFEMIFLGLLLSIICSIILIYSGIQAILGVLKQKPMHIVTRLATAIPLLLVILGGIVGGVIFGPPDAACQPFPTDLPYQTPLYKQGDSGYNTFKIPTMIRAANGTLLAFAEARVSNQEDWGKMDMVVRKSYDGGFNWTPLQVVVTESELTIGNTCPVVDQSTGFIWIVFCKENDRCFVMHSEDNGETWSTPIDITNSVKLPNWSWYATGPTHGIQLKDGTLMIPADHIVNRKMISHVIYSKDHGATWQLGGDIGSGEEGTIVELDNGDLYMNVRPVKPSYRVTSFSTDKGLTWINYSKDETLPDAACQGSLIRMENPALPNTSIYIFSNSADSIHREKMTVRISYDQCRTWTVSKVLYTGMTSYSDLCVVDPANQIIGCMFERGCNYYAEEIVFTRFPLSYISN